MAALQIIVGTVGVTWVTIYTASFGWVLWRKQNRRGAVGLFLLAAAAVIVPLLVLWKVSR